MSLNLAEILEAKQEFEKMIKQLDHQIETMETSYLEDTKEAVHILKLRKTSLRDMITMLM